MPLALLRQAETPRVHDPMTDLLCAWFGVLLVQSVALLLLHRCINDLIGLRP